jgi:hypothetical protein
MNSLCPPSRTACPFLRSTSWSHHPFSTMPHISVVGCQPCVVWLRYALLSCCALLAHANTGTWAGRERRCTTKGGIALLAFDDRRRQQRWVRDSRSVRPADAKFNVFAQKGDQDVCVAWPRQLCPAKALLLGIGSQATLGKSLALVVRAQQPASLHSY